MKDTTNKSFIDIDTQKVWFGKLIESIEESLLDLPRYQLYSHEWKTFAPNHAGVYFLWENASIIYVGESANIQKRMLDLQRTRNHTLRRKIGRELFSKHELYSEASSKDNYHKVIEDAINSYAIEKITVSYLPLVVGRKEVESYFIKRIPLPKYNSISKR